MGNERMYGDQSAARVFVLACLALLLAVPAYPAGGAGHYYVARASAERIMQSQGMRADFREALKDPLCLNAFCNGAIAPDLGCLSDQSHHGDTSRLFTAMLGDAETALQQAQQLPDDDPSKPEKTKEAMKGICFAFGWLSHCATDIAVHPKVNARTGDAYEFCDTSKKAKHAIIEIQLSRYLAKTLKKPGWKISFDIPTWLVAKSSGASEKQLRNSVKTMRLKLKAELIAADNVGISYSELEKEWKGPSQRAIDDTVAFVTAPCNFSAYDLDYGPISTTDFRELRKECIGINDGKLPEGWGREYVNWWETVKAMTPTARHSKLIEMIKGPEV